MLPSSNWRLINAIRNLLLTIQNYLLFITGPTEAEPGVPTTEGTTEGAAVSTIGIFK